MLARFGWTGQRCCTRQSIQKSPLWPVAGFVGCDNFPLAFSFSPATIARLTRGQRRRRKDRFPFSPLVPDSHKKRPPEWQPSFLYGIVHSSPAANAGKRTLLVHAVPTAVVAVGCGRGGATDRLNAHRLANHGPRGRAIVRIGQRRRRRRIELRLGLRDRFHLVDVGRLLRLLKGAPRRLGRGRLRQRRRRT